MLIKSDTRKQKQYPNPANEDDRATIYIAPQQYMDPNKNHVARVEINGYVTEVPFGKEVEVPRSVLNELKNAKSAISSSPGGMSTPHRVDTARGGDESGRKQDEIRYVNDYHIIER